MKIETTIKFLWDTNDENEDRTEQTFEEWAEYYKGLMVEDMNTLVINNEVLEAISVKEVTE